MQVYVLDPHLQPVPVGVTGELFVGGVGLARGYLNRPELTAEKFIPHPFRDEPGARLYRTGDLVRYLPDGNLEFIGRIDHLVKLRGFRIELGEVEAVLNQHENVRQAAVIAHEVQPGDLRLIAYLVPQRDVKLSAADLRAFLREKVPEHMVPGAFEFLDSLPLTPSGKVNRRALPGLRGLDTDPEAVYNPPRNEIERAIAAVWQEVLQVERVSIYDNFFDLGGHSLLMFQVYSKLRNVLAKELTMNDMFRYPTINALAHYCSQEQAGRLAFSSIHQRTARQKQARTRNRRSPVGEQHE
jgi:acyl carrier protein